MTTNFNLKDGKVRWERVVIALSSLIIICVAILFAAAFWPKGGEKMTVAQKIAQLCDADPAPSQVRVGDNMYPCVQDHTDEPNAEAEAPETEAEPATEADDADATDENVVINTDVVIVQGANVCPTDAEVTKMLGNGIVPVFTGEGVSWDPCKWSHATQGSNGSVDIEIPAEWQVTAALADGTVRVYYGPAEIKGVVAFTLRYLPASPAEWSNKCNTLVRENEFGLRRVPSYNTTAGNFTCIGAVVEAVTVVDATPEPEFTCPTTTAEIAELIGGNASNWTEPDWPGGAWTYRGSFTNITAPKEGTLDYWNSAKNSADVLEPNDVLSLNLASYTCTLSE